MKRSHKRGALGDVQSVVDAAPTLDEAARRLGINRSTLTRWLQTGKVQRPGGKPLQPPASSIPVPDTPNRWAESVRAAYTLSETEQQLVMLADRALRMAHDPATGGFTRLSSMARFQALVKQLNLMPEKRKDAREATPAGRPVMARQVATAPRPSVDPRAILAVVK